MLIRIVLAVADKQQRQYLAEYLADSGVQITTCDHRGDPWQMVVNSCSDIIVINESYIQPLIESGIAQLNNLPEKPVTVILSNTDVPEASASLVASGADVVLYAGISKAGLADAVESILESRRQLDLSERYDQRGRIRPRISDFFSQNQEMQFFVEQVQQVIPSDSPLLILGETGVGKEHLAKAIHAESKRSAGPFVAVNIAAMPEQLLESELFGHEKGAFTGAIRSRRGAFELAHGGTIFLDEIGDMPLHMQTKLLRVLQELEVTPVGSEKTFWVDVRVIAATNRDLEKETRRGHFRQDLFYRLGVVSLTIPPLRKRRDDIQAMAEHFMGHFRHKIGRDIKGITDPVKRALYRYDWPGNVRELMNVMERAILLCKGREISLQDLPGVFHEDPGQWRERCFTGVEDVTSWEGMTLPEVERLVLDQVERRYLEMVLRKTGGRTGQAAKIAGIHPRNLYNKMKHLDLKKETFKKR